jgi:two-component system, chemotaxis family, sensor kinase Cph1
VSVKDALTGAQENLRAAITESGVVISASEQLPRVRADALQLQQVFQNLLSNAIKYRRHSGPAHVHVGGRTDHSAHVITVRDNGIGLDMQYADIIFRPFKRLHGPDVPGSGVGLAICKNIIESLGGSIWVESEGHGKGVAFHFSIPKS